MDFAPPPPSSRERFVALVEAHRGILHSVGRAYCWDDAERDDLVQEMLVQAWRAFPRYDAGRPFGTWLYRLALNVAISYVRRAAPRRGRTVPLDPDLHDRPAPRGAPAEDVRVAALRRLVQACDPLDRALLLLYLDDRPHAEIADVLGLTVTNVATKIHRLKRRLRRDLGDLR